MVGSDIEGTSAWPSPVPRTWLNPGRHHLFGSRGASKITLLDEDIFAQYGHLHWHVNQAGYVYRWVEHKRDVRTLVLLHRLVMEAQPGKRIDPIFGDKLDARRSQLRRCTNAENLRNMDRKQLNMSGYKGVTFSSQQRFPWRAQSMFDYQTINLGHCATAEEAAYVYDQAALQLFGEYARLNLL